MTRAAVVIAVGVFVAVSACGRGRERVPTARSAGTTTTAAGDASSTTTTTTLTTTTTVTSATTLGSQPAPPRATSRTPAPGATAAAASTATTAAARPRVLVFSRTLRFRHESIGPGVTTVRELGAANGFDVDATEDQSVFTSANLSRYRAVVFLSTTGDVLGPAEESALEQYVRGGGGFAGIHAAADTEYGWAFYEMLLGTRFKQHPEIQQATVVSEDPSHASTARLPARWVRSDEWYDFRTNPRGAVHVLLALDESTYQGGTMGADHPIAWCHSVGAGRSWYSGLGHTNETFAEPLYRTHLAGGLRYAIGTASSCG